MNNLSAFMMGETNRHKELKVFDWDKAARIIKERNPKKASAGLSGDWECTGGDIFAWGKVIPKKDTYTYLASTWATPELEVDNETLDCFIMESQMNPDWGKVPSDVYWPESALAILGAIEY